MGDEDGVGGRHVGPVEHKTGEVGEAVNPVGAVHEDAVRIRGAELVIGGGFVEVAVHEDLSQSLVPSIVVYQGGKQLVNHGLQNLVGLAHGGRLHKVLNSRFDQVCGLGPFRLPFVTIAKDDEAVSIIFSSLSVLRAELNLNFGGGESCGLDPDNLLGLVGLDQQRFVKIHVADVNGR